ncbi:glucosamine-6-phosphate deaminase [Virgibacillus phasianinus]|uniref:Glucosamine-6-phosphate deaminase n=1 Tax=Virgibacillus phasianinus TaxID=2017483 RepID=A0A220U471_9BACI|nr:glucosamine-6-phosphate deaminase [Virgibacillus phasianinus]ASK62716.1 glucosamine-6-phosphate deaminase [Virgibacillus phasianinus]
MNIVKVKNYDEMSNKACQVLVDRMNKVNNPVLGLATGSTPEGLYKELIKTSRKGDVSFKHTTTFNLDEYIGLSKSNANSYHYYMKNHLFQYIDVNMDNVHVPKGDVLDIKKECQEYEKSIRSHGNIDLQILGLGANGHIGFNEPGTSFNSRTHIVDLAESTRQANARFFDSYNDVPEQAITMGIETILESKEIIVLVSGNKKAEALSRLVNGKISEDFPASVLKEHIHVTVIADEAALSAM